MESRQAPPLVWCSCRYRCQAQQAFQHKASRLLIAFSTCQLSSHSNDSGRGKSASARRLNAAWPAVFAEDCVRILSAQQEELY